MSEKFSAGKGAARKGGMVAVRIAQLDHAVGLPLPQYQTAGAAGLDLVAAVPEGKPLRIGAGRHALVPTGLTMQMPAGWEAQVRPRSGLALKHGVTVLNSPGTIDSDYRGEVGVILVNLGRKAFKVARGERIAQMVIAPATQVRLLAVAPVALDKSARGSGGFGSTGTAIGAAARKVDRAPGRKSARRSVKGAGA